MSYCVTSKVLVDKEIIISYKGRCIPYGSLKTRKFKGYTALHKWAVGQRDASSLVCDVVALTDTLSRYVSEYSYFFVQMVVKRELLASPLSFVKIKISNIRLVLYK